MAATDFLFQGAVPVPAPSGSDVASGGPLWLQSQLFNLSNAAGNLAQQPYQPFPGPQIAAPSDQTQQAWQMAGQNIGGWKPYADQAGALNASASAPITGQDISTFLNPYQDYITGALNRNLTSNILPSIQDKFVSAGQSRSPQEAQVTNNAIYDTQQAVGQSLAQGYGGALNALIGQRGQQLTGAGQFAQLGTQNSQLNAIDAGQVAAAGQGRDQVAQANVNAALNNFQQQRDYPYQQLGYLSNIIRGIPVQAAGTNTQTVSSGYADAYGPSPLATFAGAAQQAAKLGFARGGPVPIRRGALSLAPMRLAA